MAHTKIGIHFIDGNDAGVGYNREAAPTVVMLVNAFKDSDKIVGLPHKPLVIGRISRSEVAIEDWIESRPPAEALAQIAPYYDVQIRNNRAIEYWALICEPITKTKERMEWVDEFNRLSAEWLRGYGKKLVAGNWSVGNPPREMWRYIPKTLELTRSHYGAIIGLHRYLELIRTPTGAVDIAATVNGFWGLYHEKLDIPDFAALGYAPKIAITETGLEYIGNGKAWREENIPASVYAHILHEWDRVLQRSPQVIGAAVFTCGGKGWEKHNIADSEVMTHLTNWAKTQTAPSISLPPPPTPPKEKPLPGEGVHGGGMMWRFYSEPNINKPLPPRKISHFIEFFEKRAYGGEAGVWVRVTGKESGLNWWMRMGV